MLKAAIWILRICSVSSVGFAVTVLFSSIGWIKYMHSFTFFVNACTFWLGAHVIKQIITMRSING